jgi:TRAP-type C4-dicarboxylate transport system permease small subunit
MSFESIVTKTTKLLLYFGGVLLGVMMLITMVNVVGRYVFNSPIFGQSELVELLQIVSISLAGAYTVIERRHVAIGLIVDRLSPRKQLFFDCCTYLVSLGFCALASYVTIEYAVKVMHNGKTTDMLKIVMSPFYYMVGIGWALLCLGIVVCLIDFGRRLVKR